MPDAARKWLETDDPLDGLTFREYNARMHVNRLLPECGGSQNGVKLYIRWHWFRYDATRKV